MTQLDLKLFRMKRFLLTSIFLLLPLLFACGHPGKPFQLLDSFHSCTIVMDLGDYKSADEASSSCNDINWFDNDFSDDAICTYALAAIELRKYFSLLTGIPEAEIPIKRDDSSVKGNILFVGPAPANPVYSQFQNKIDKRWKRTKSQNPQGFRVDTYSDESGHYVFLSGRTPVAVLYAAYELLQRLGVRWFAPGEMGEHIPDRQEIIMPAMHEYREPAMELRGFGCGSVATQTVVKTHANSSQNSKNTAFLQWMGRNRLNYFWHSMGPVGQLGQRGIKIYCEDSELVDHCLTDEGELQELSNKLMQKLQQGEWSDVDVVQFTIDDTSRLCTCQQCQQKGNATDRFLYALSFIGNRFEQAFQSGDLQRRIRVIGVVNSRDLVNPLHTPAQKFPYDNVSIMIAPWERCYNHSLWDTLCTEANVPIAERLDEWFSKSNPYKGKTFMQVGFNMPVFRDLPLVFTNILRADMPHYFSIGVRGMTYCKPRLSHLGVQTLLNYQFSTLLWNPERNMDSLTDEFFQLYYAGLSDLMKEYYADIEKAMANIQAWRGEFVDRLHAYTKGELNEPVLPLNKYAQHFRVEEYLSRKNDGVDWATTLQLIHEARYIMDDALSRSVSDIVTDRLMEDEYQLRYAELTVRLYDNVIRLLTLGEDEPEMREEAALRLRDIANKLEQFEIYCPAYGVTNGLEATEIKSEVQYLLRKSQQQSVKKYRRVYE